MDTVAQPARRAGAPARPRPVLRFYVEGRPVSGPEFWEAIRRAGGQALVTAHAPTPLEPRYRLTEQDRAALARGEGK